MYDCIVDTLVQPQSLQLYLTKISPTIGMQTREGNLWHLPPQKFQNTALQFWHLQKLSKNKDEVLYSNHFKKSNI